MAKVVSFDRDVPCLKAKFRPLDVLFSMRLTGEYLVFAGAKELRAFRVAASNGILGFWMEFEDSGALVAWLRDSLGMYAEEAYGYPERALRGETVPIHYYLSESNIQSLGFEKRCSSFNPPSIFDLSSD